MRDSVGKSILVCRHSAQECFDLQPYDAIVLEAYFKS